MSPPASPRTYADWCAVLDRFQSGDCQAVAEMESGSLEWTSGVAERFTRRIDEAFVQRLKFLQKELQRTLEVTRSRQELHHLATAMVGFRRALDPLLRAAAIPALPEEVRAHLRGRVEKLAAGVQSSLEGSAREFRSGGEHVLAIVRQNRVDVRPPVAQPAPSSGTDPLPPAGVAQRRRILI